MLSPRFVIMQNTIVDCGRLPWMIVDNETGSPIKRKPLYLSLRCAVVRARQLNMQHDEGRRKARPANLVEFPIAR